MNAKDTAMCDIGYNPERKAYCPNCCEETVQTPTLYDPDDPASPEVWTCSVCYEELEFVDE